jgi:CHASE2 domain-containing sensor protein
MASMQGWKDFHSFLWIQSLSLACFFAFWRIRQPGESRRVYLTNPRVIVTNLSALAFGAIAIWSLAHHLR